MNYVGQEIIHKGKYGKGRIIAQDEKYISVSFDSSKEPIKFVYPECFKRFLQLVDTEAAQRAEKENVRRDAVKEEEAEKKREEFQAIVIQNSYISDPIALIDKAIVWYGMPSSNATFISEGYKIPTRVRPIVRIEGKYFNQALYGFLGVNQTVDASVPMISDEGRYDTFAAYVAGEIKCPKCGNAMRLKKSKKNRFFMACSNYPECEYTQYVEPKTVKDYFYLYDKYGKRCPRDNTTLFAGVGRTGLYICCGGNEKHFFNLDEV